MASGGARPGAGRKAGSVNRRTVEMLADLVSDGKKLPVEYMLDLMRNEDADAKDRQWAAAQAAPFIHPRPAPLERTVEIDLPDTSTIEGIGKALDKVIQTLGAGEISPSEAQSIISVIDARRKAMETSEILDRIVALEAALPASGEVR